MGDSFSLMSFPSASPRRQSHAARPRTKAIAPKRKLPHDPMVVDLERVAADVRRSRIVRDAATTALEELNNSRNDSP